MNELIKRIRLSWVIAALLVASILMISRLRHWEHGEVIKGKVLENYACLPALFIGTNADTIPAGENEVCNRTCPPRIGMTLSYLPFFALGHLYAKFSEYAMDGFSAPYQLAIQLSSILYLIIGLLYL